MMPSAICKSTVVTACALAAGLAASQAQQSPVARGIVALPNEDGRVTVGWRVFDSDARDAGFHIYRRDIYAGPDFVRVTETPVVDSTTFVDKNARPGSSYRYRVHALAGGREVPSSDTPTSPPRTGTGRTSRYRSPVITPRAALAPAI